MAYGRANGYRFHYDHASDDWSNGCTNDGPGYYGRNMTCGQIIGRLLMNGRGVSGRDMTAGADEYIAPARR